MNGTSEEAFLRRLAARWGRVFDSAVEIGIGDDGALLRWTDERLVVATDALVEGVHFRRRTTTWPALGAKLILVNLSDMAAMGARGRFVLLHVAVDPADAGDLLEDLYTGIDRVCRTQSLVVVGGDTTASPGPLTLCATVLGRLSGSEPLRRSGARPGDLLMVSGPLGAAVAGLAALESGPLPAGGGPIDDAIRHHRCPDLDRELALGPALADARLATAAIDVSDGLMLDLSRLCRASGVGARVAVDDLPLHPAHGKSMSPVERLRAACGGEDYRLLFTLPPHRLDEVRQLPGGDRATVIGEILPLEAGLDVVSPAGDVSAPVMGYDAFGGAQ